MSVCQAVESVCSIYSSKHSQLQYTVCITDGQKELTPVYDYVLQCKASVNVCPSRLSHVQGDIFCDWFMSTGEKNVYI